jgi:hypothetical protein
LEDFDNDKDVEMEQKIEKGLMALCFLVFALVGYVLTRFIQF